MSKFASTIVSLAQSWVGIKEGSEGHQMILDIYNSQKPLPRGYKMKIKDHWCAATTTALAVKSGYTDIIPCECSCSKLIEKAKKKGIWVEDESVTPKIGWLCIYDWDDDGKGDCKGDPEHIGIVEKVSGKTFTVIEGNYSDSVKRRTLDVNGRYLRGFIAPKYDEEAKEEKTEVNTEVKKDSVEATDYADEFNKSIAGTYEVTASMLNVRHGAGTNKKVMCVIPDGTKVKNYGYYTTVGGVKWLYIQFTYKGVLYTGFASSTYLYKK